MKAKDFKWRFAMDLMPRVFIMLSSIAITHVVGSVMQMCFSEYATGICYNPQYTPFPYIWTTFGILIGFWGIFLYSFWDETHKEEHTYE